MLHTVMLTTHELCDQKKNNSMQHNFVITQYHSVQHGLPQLMVLQLSHALSTSSKMTTCLLSRSKSADKQVPIRPFQLFNRFSEQNAVGTSVYFRILCHIFLANYSGKFVLPHTRNGRGCFVLMNTTNMNLLRSYHGEGAWSFCVSLCTQS